MGHSWALFRLFNTQLTVKMFNNYKFLPITGLELETSGIGSNCYTN